MIIFLQPKYCPKADNENQKPFLDQEHTNPITKKLSSPTAALNSETQTEAHNNRDIESSNQDPVSIKP